MRTKSKLLIIIVMVLINYNNFLNGQMICKTEYQEEQVQSHAPIEGPMFVKLELFVIKQNDGTGGWSDESIEDLILELDEVYGEHDIYFNYCISDIYDSDAYNNTLDFNYMNSYLSSNGLDDENAIKGFLLKNNPNPHPAGVAYSTPGDKFISYDEYTFIVVHEIGHCLGLLHTFHNGCDEDAPYKDSNGNWKYGDNAYVAGDQVYDTPADVSMEGKDSEIGLCDQKTGFYFNSATGECEFLNPKIGDIVQVDNNGNEYADPFEYLTYNYMRYGMGGCNNKIITHGQAEKIRKDILLKVVQNEGAFTKVFNKNFVINDKKFWTDNRIINGNVYVNRELNIKNNNEIAFTPGHKIIVRPDAKLGLYETTLDVNLTNNCTETDESLLWGGIEYDFTNSNLNGVPLVEVWESNIKNSNRGISTIGDGYKDIELIIWKSNFYDNKRAVELTNTNGYVQIYKSGFYYNRPLNDIGIRRSQIEFVNSTGWISRSEVLNETDISSAEGIAVPGISVYNSNIHVNLKVSGWEIGVKKGWGASKTFSTSNSDYFNNESSLKLDRSYAILEIKDNKFHDGTIGCEIINDLKSGFIVKNNEFYNLENGINHKTSYNIHRGDGGLYYNNYFHDILENGIRWNNSNKYDGPLFLCNIMDNDGIPFISSHIVTIGGINNIQANIDNQNYLRSAGNTYVKIEGFNFLADEYGDVKYYWQKDNEEPINYEGLTIMKTEKESLCPDDYFDNSGVGGIGHTSDDGRYSKEVERKTHIEDTISVCGGGNAVLDTLEVVTLSNANSVVTMLTDLGPWLSEEAAELFVQTANVFTPSQIVQVLSANPDVMMNDVVNQFVFGVNSPLSLSEQQLLHNAFGVTTERTKLLVELTHINQRISMIISDAMNKIIFHSDGAIDYSDLRKWMRRKEGIGSMIDISETFISEGDFDSAITYLQNLLSGLDLTSSQTEDLNKYIELDQMLKNAYLNKRYEATLDSNEISILYNIAYSGTIFAKDKARGILEYFYGSSFEDDEIPENINLVFRNTNRRNDDIGRGVEIFPDPNNGEFEIKLDKNIKNIFINNVKILTLEGNILFDKEYNDKSKSVKVVLDGLSRGLYLYRVKSNKGEIISGKFIVE